MRSTEYYKECIPVWALNALINDDYSGLEEEDINLIENWLKVSGYTHVCCPDDESLIYFTGFPAFGKACHAIDCWCHYPNN